MHQKSVESYFGGGELQRHFVYNWLQSSGDIGFTLSEQNALGEPLGMLEISWSVGMFVTIPVNPFFMHCNKFGFIFSASGDGNGLAIMFRMKTCDKIKNAYEIIWTFVWIHQLKN